MKELSFCPSCMAKLTPEDGKLSLTVAIGCTGGHHRSVAIASALTDYLVADGIRAVNVNRDLDK